MKVEFHLFNNNMLYNSMKNNQLGQIILEGKSQKENYDITEYAYRPMSAYMYEGSMNFIKNKKQEYPSWNY